MTRKHDPERSTRVAQGVMSLIGSTGPYRSRASVSALRVGIFSNTKRIPLRAYLDDFEDDRIVRVIFIEWIDKEF